MKLILAGLWVALVSLGAAYAAALYWPGGSDGKGAAAPVALQTQKTRVINVPILVDGALRGFVAAQFVLAEDGNVLKTLQVPPDAYLLDEAFRTLYADAALDPRHVDRYDLKALTAHLVKDTNERLGAPLLKDVLIDSFVYIDKDAKG